MSYLLSHGLHAHGRDWGISIAVLCAAILVGVFAHSILLRIFSNFRDQRPRRESQLLALAHRMYRPARWIVILTALGLVLPLLHIPPFYFDRVSKTISIFWFVALGWLMIAGVYAFEDALMRRYDISASNNLRARRARTQLQLLRRIAISLLLVMDAGFILSLFENSRIWHYGAGLLASAGVASLVLATAAKSTVSNMLAGLQIALTEPIRLDDVVIVQGEWGRVEEITTSYVVVAIWDQRRLIVPLTYFIEQPFQNWTRETSELLGTAFLYVDYSIPVEELRQEFRRVLEQSPLWDRKVCSLQVTNLSEHTMEIRCLLSAANSSEQFDLRCLVREKMIAFIQQNYPDAFPRTRFSSISHAGRPSPDGHSDLLNRFADSPLRS